MHSYFIGEHVVPFRNAFKLRLHPRNILEKHWYSLIRPSFNSYTYYILLIQETIFSFAHSTFLTINSLSSSLLFVFLSLLTPSLSPPLAYSLPTDFSLYLPLFSFFSLFLLSSITSLFNKGFFSSSQIGQQFYKNFLYWSNSLYWISLPVKLSDLCGILNYIKWNLWV